MKKAFYILFTLYFLALAIIPCSDKEDCNEFKQTEISRADHQQTHADEVCTPFCACACCAAHFLLSASEPELFLKSIIFSGYINHASSDLKEASFTIWQPPKLV